MKSRVKKEKINDKRKKVVDKKTKRENERNSTKMIVRKKRRNT